MRWSVPLAAVALVGACIPARLPVRPVVQGVVRVGEQPAVGLPLVLAEGRADSTCPRVAARTTTDSTGAFRFPGRRAWRLVPLLGVADARFTWHVCGGTPVRPAYAGGHFGGVAAPATDRVSCESRPAEGGTQAVRCVQAAARPGEPRE